MSVPQFTPGPYLYGPDFDETDGDYILKEIDGNLQSIGEAFDRCPVTGLSIPPKERGANACLWSAAPDLYAALDAVFVHLLFAFDHQETAIRIGRDSGNIHPGDLAIARKELHKFATRIDAARAALAKARGEAQR